MSAAADKFTEHLSQYLAEIWPKPRAAAVLALVFMATAILALDADHTLFGNVGYAGVIVLAGVLAVLLWYHSNWIPRPPKGSVGLVLAIACDDEAEQKVFRRDFIERLRAQVSQDREQTKFHLIAVKRRQAEEVADTEVASRLVLKLGAALMIYGRVRRTTGSDGKAMHVVNLEAVIVHPTTGEDGSKLLRDEMNTTMPRRVLVPEVGSLFSFERASIWLDTSVRYCLGLAALVTGQLAYAEVMFKSVAPRAAGDGHRIPAMAHIAKRFNTHMISLYATWLFHLVRQYVVTCDEGLMPEIDRLADAILERKADAYGALLAKAIVVFVTRRDVAQAKHLLRRAKGPDPTWRYSLAFIYAYEGRMDDADAEYRKAFKCSLEDYTVPIQSEEFIHNILAKEPQQGRLYYCSGLLNYHAKGDVLGARRDFEAFLASADAEKYPKQRVIAETLLQRLPDEEPSMEDAVPVDLQLRPLVREDDDDPAIER